MKTLSLLFIISLSLVSSCSSPRERHAERQVEAREDYDKDLKQSQEQYEDDEMQVKRNKAKEMIDESDSVQLEEDQGKIQVDD